MEYDVKPKILIRQEKGFPQTISQLIQKYKLDALWENIEKIVKEVIEQNSGYVVKRDGVMYIADTNILEEAKVVLRIGKNFLDISNNGFEGDYQTIISLNGIINANFIKTGTMQADRIKGGTLTLGGNENGNGSIDIKDNSGNTNVLINNNGILLKDGTKIIGGDGVYCNLQFFPPIQYASCGYIFKNDMDCASQEYLSIYADIPNNFVIESAYITIRHQPVTWNYWDIKETKIKEVIGYSRNIQIYIDDLIPKEKVYIDSETLKVDEIPGIKTNAMGDLGKTFSSSIIETALSTDLKQYLKSGKQTVFNIGSTTKASSISSIDVSYEQTGNVMATLNVLGFLKK